MKIEAGGDAPSAPLKPRRRDAMRKWSRPTVVEIAVGMEINCYACAEI
jgi:coenzyme PQQ precursor peptide PqqA